MKINITCPSRYKIDREFIKKSVSSYLEKKAIKPTEDSILNIAFVGKIKMRSLAAKYKGEDVALPVLTFPFNEKLEEENLIGEIIICYPSAVLMAAEKEKKLNKIIEFLLQHALNVLFKV